MSRSILLFMRWRRQELGEMGYTIAAYPLTLLSAGMRAMRAALARLKAGEACDDLLLPFSEVSSPLRALPPLQAVQTASAAAAAARR
jgi:2-methylisocitrate lyase-like PEP mutase family enzyme